MTGNQFSALNQLSKILKSAVEIEFILALLRDESFKNMLNKLRIFNSLAIKKKL